MISINRAARSGALALVLATTLSACDSFLDVNTDPNNPTHVRMEQTLPAVLAVFHRSILDGNPTEWSTQWLQQWSYNRDNYGYSQIQLYELTSIDTDAFWGDLYADVGQETVNIMAETEKTGDWAYHGIAKFIHAWTMTIATDMYGPIPFTEAFDPLNPDPAYDSEKVVYDAAHEMIAEAIDEMQRPSARVPGDNDLLFGGDMDRWVQLARSVQARLHLRLVKAPGENATARAQAALDALAGGITEDATFDYLGGADARSPMYGYRADDWDSSTTISKTFVDLLRGLDDPRLAVLARPAEYDGVIRGHVPGQPRNTTGDAFFDEGERPDAPGVAFNDSIISKLSNVITESHPERRRSGGCAIPRGHPRRHGATGHRRCHHRCLPRRIAVPDCGSESARGDHHTEVHRERPAPRAIQRLSQNRLSGPADRGCTLRPRYSAAAADTGGRDQLQQ
jgi:hypothetical protein